MSSKHARATAQGAVKDVKQQLASSQKKQDTSEKDARWFLQGSSDLEGREGTFA